MPVASPAHPRYASGVGVAEQVGAGGRDGHAGPGAPSLPGGLFLTQPVQLVHVVVSGERNLGNVVIWRRTCPLRRNGTVLGESQGAGTGCAGTGTVVGTLPGCSPGQWPGRGVGQNGYRRCWAPGAGLACPTAVHEDSHICFPYFFPMAWERGGRGQDLGPGCAEGDAVVLGEARAGHQGPLSLHFLAAPCCRCHLTWAYRTA